MTDVSIVAVEFLRDALTQQNPERVKARAVVLRDLLSQCDDERAVWQGVITELSCEAASFSRVVHLVTLYVDEKRGDEVVGHGAKLLREALEHRNYRLSELLESAAKGYFWTGLGQALPGLSLDEAELQLLAKNCRPEGELSVGAFHRWASSHPAAARRFVESNFAKLVELATSRRDALVGLVEGGVRRESDIGWRDRIVEQLLRDVDEQVVKHGIMLAACAWPHDTNVGVRHAHILSLVRHAPRARGRAALLALRRDALMFPAETVDTTLHLIELARLESLPVDQASPFAEAALDAVGLALSRSEQTGVAIEPDERLGRLVQSAAPTARHALDSLLAGAYRIKPDLARHWLEQWLTRFGGAIDHISLRDLFPLLVHSAGPSVLSRWYVGLITSSSPIVRLAASRLLGGDERMSLDRDAVYQLATNEFEGLVHQLLGVQALRAEHIARLLLELGECRPSDLVFIEQAAHELATVYPGACRDELNRRIEVRDGGPAETVRLTGIEENVAALLQTRERRLGEVLELPEVAAASPAVAEYRMLQSRQQRQIAQQAHEQSLMMLLASRQPIACGEGTLRRPDDDDVVQFTKHEFSAELPAAEVIDPVGSRLSRFKHLQQAEALLKAGRSR